MEYQNILGWFIENFDSSYELSISSSDSMVGGYKLITLKVSKFDPFFHTTVLAQCYQFNSDFIDSCVSRQAAEKIIKSRLLEMKADIEKEYSETNRTYVFKREE